MEFKEKRMNEIVGIHNLIKTECDKRKADGKNIRYYVPEDDTTPNEIHINITRGVMIYIHFSNNGSLKYQASFFSNFWHGFSIVLVANFQSTLFYDLIYETAYVLSLVNNDVNHKIVVKELLKCLEEEEEKYIKYDKSDGYEWDK